MRQRLAVSRRDVALGLFGASIAGGAMTSCTSPPGVEIAKLSFSDLNGWADADFASAQAAFTSTLSIARGADAIGLDPGAWTDLARDAARMRFRSPRAFFEALFTPVLVTDGADGLFTAYFEPEVLGARTPSHEFAHPLYMRPGDLGDGPYFSRAEIATGALKDRGLELLWLNDPVDAFFLEIQGSGLVRTPEGERIRIGFAGKNNHPYTAIGKVLVEEGALTLKQATAEGIKSWLRANPSDAAQVMNANASYVFFEEKLGLSSADGPIGAMGASVTGGVSVAVDPRFQPLGAPVWVEASGVEGYQGRLMVAQDVGGAIKGAQRADLFVGSGDAAGAFASAIRAKGRIVTLLPRSAADLAGAA